MLGWWVQFGPLLVQGISPLVRSILRFHRLRLVAEGSGSVNSATGKNSKLIFLVSCWFFNFRAACYFISWKCLTLIKHHSSLCFYLNLLATVVWILWLHKSVEFSFIILIYYSWNQLFIHTSRKPIKHNLNVMLIQSILVGNNFDFEERVEPRF